MGGFVKRFCRRTVSNSVDHLVFVFDEGLVVAEGIVEGERKTRYLVVKMHVGTTTTITDLLPVLLVQNHVQQLVRVQELSASRVTKKKVSIPYP